MKKCVQCILYCCMLCYGVSGLSPKFIEALPGQTIVLKYRLNATNADWFGPLSGTSYVNKDIGSDIALDRNGENKTWNTIQYTDDVVIRNNLPHKNRLHIVGNNIKGKFFLEIRNVSVDDTGLYKCIIYTFMTLMTNISSVTRLFIVNLKYVPDLLITFKPRMPIVEGSSLSLCCLSKNILPKETFEWLNKRRGLQERQTRGKTCLGFQLIHRNDSGTYTCKAEHEGKIVTKNVTLRVLYPPIVVVRNHTFNQNDTNRKLVCFPDGDPQNYTDSKWEHRSFFNEHIRYFNDETRHLVLPFQDKQHLYKDSGIYICSVSNGVPDKNGIYVQNGSSNVFSKGPPVFVKDNTRIQYGEKGKHMDLKVNVYSISNITCHYISTDHVENILLNVTVNRITTADQLQGKPFKIMVWQIVFRFTTLTSEHLKKYTVTVCNEHGHSKYAISLQFRESEIHKKHVEYIVTVIVCCIILALVIMTMVKCLVIIRRRDILNVQDVNEIAEGESEAVENILYQSNQQPMPNISEVSPASTLLHEDTSSETTLSERGTIVNVNMQTRNIMENHLNYADVVFQPSSSSQDEVLIIGSENRTVYADVDTSVRVSLPDIQSETSSSDDDFVYVDGIQNFIEKRETNN